MNTSKQSSLRGPLGISLLALLIIGVFLVAMMPAIYRSASTVFTSGTDEAGSIDNLIVAHSGNMDTDLDRFNGRSFFYLPPIKRRPAPPPPPPPPPVVTEPVEPPPPPPPTYPPNYTGPKLIAILGDEAWFRKPSSLKFGVEDPKTRIRVGETMHGIELLSTNPPRGIEVKYNDGGPYEVPLIDMDSDPFSKDIDASVPRGILEDIDEEEAAPASPPPAVETPAEPAQEPPSKAVSPETPAETPAEQDPPQPPVPSQSPGGLDELE